MVKQKIAGMFYSLEGKDSTTTLCRILGEVLPILEQEELERQKNENKDEQKTKPKRPRKSQGVAQEKSATTTTKSKFSDNFQKLDLQLHGVRLPSFDIPKEEKHKIKVSEDVNNYDFLRALCLHGFKELGLKRGPKNTTNM